MIITYLGKQFFKIQQGEMVIAFNPVSKNSKLDISAKFGADIALITTNLPEYNGKEQLSHGEREPFIIDGGGDYEVKEIFIKGLNSEAKRGNEKYINTIYSLVVDGIKIVFLGALSNPDLSKEANETISNTDILFVPVGGGDVLDSKQSAKFVASLEPKMIIPMDYDNSSLKAFLKEMGEDDIKKIDKLTIKKKEVDSKEGEIIVFE